MKYFTFAIALTAYAANAIAIQAEEPDIEIHIAGLDEMENYHGEELVEINIGDIDWEIFGSDHFALAAQELIFGEVGAQSEL